MTIKNWLKIAQEKLKISGISSPKLDAEIILSDVLKKDKTWLIACSEEKLLDYDIKKAEEFLKRRLNHEPIAYIRGFKEFYGRNFKVNENVLIPRPESEALIELAKNCELKSVAKILDVGTGSGILGITLKLELPKTEVTLLEVSKPALKTAQKNAKSLNAEVNFAQKDIFNLKPNDKLINTPFDLIIANLPYVDESWQRSPATDFEPDLALFSAENGLWHYKKFLQIAPSLLAKNGKIILEVDPRQLGELLKYAVRLNFKLICKNHLAITLIKL